MFRLPEEDIDQLWRQMGENKDWKGFMKTVMAQCGRINSMDSLTVDYLVREAYELKNQKMTFPETPGGLYKVLSLRSIDQSTVINGVSSKRMDISFLLFIEKIRKMNCLNHLANRSARGGFLFWLNHHIIQHRPGSQKLFEVGRVNRAAVQHADGILRVPKHDDGMLVGRYEQGFTV